MTSSVIEPAKTGASGAAVCECGYDPARLDPAGILTTLRTIPTRFRSALAFNLADGDPEAILLTAPRPGGWSSLEHAAHVRDVLHAFDTRIRRLADRDGMSIAPIPQTPPTGVREQGAPAILAALGSNADRLTRTLGNLAPHMWERTGRRENESIAVIDLAREAVHETTHHLRDASAVIEQARRGTSAVG